MIFTSHSELKGLHAYLGASKNAWLNYDDEKFDRVYIASLAAMRGTQLHELASQLIKLKVRLPRTTKTLDSFVNDVLGLKMESEQILFYSENAFGCADAIKFDEKKMKLWIFDLKTGTNATTMKQLRAYVALFCLEYGYNPNDLDVELRIYQNDEIKFDDDYDPMEIMYIMDRYVTRDKRIKQLRKEML